jgi:hypothetical protein
MSDDLPQRPQRPFSQRLQDVWDHPTPFGLIAQIKAAVDAVNAIPNVMDSSARWASPSPSTEEEAYWYNQARDRLPGAAFDVVQEFAPGIPRGTGGVLGRPIGGSAVPGRSAAPANIRSDRIEGRGVPSQHELPEPNLDKGPYYGQGINSAAPSAPRPVIEDRSLQRYVGPTSPPPAPTQTPQARPAADDHLEIPPFLRRQPPDRAAIADGPKSPAPASSGPQWEPRRPPPPRYYEPSPSERAAVERSEKEAILEDRRLEKQRADEYGQSRRVYRDPIDDDHLAIPEFLRRQGEGKGSSEPRDPNFRELVRGPIVPQENKTPPGVGQVLPKQSDPNSRQPTRVPSDPQRANSSASEDGRYILPIMKPPPLVPDQEPLGRVVAEQSSGGSNSSGNGMQGGGDKNFCPDRWLDEKIRCDDFWFPGTNRWKDACRARADDRLSLCNGNRGTPDPKEPDEYDWKEVPEKNLRRYRPRK